MDTPIKNSTDEKDAPVPWKIEIASGVSLGFQIAIGFWFFTLIIGIILLVILGYAGMQLTPVPAQ